MTFRTILFTGVVQRSSSSSATGARPDRVVRILGVSARSSSSWSGFSSRASTALEIALRGWLFPTKSSIAKNPAISDSLSRLAAASGGASVFARLSPPRTTWLPTSLAQYWPISSTLALLSRSCVMPCSMLRVQALSWSMSSSGAPSSRAITVATTGTAMSATTSHSSRLPTSFRVLVTMSSTTSSTRISVRGRQNLVITLRYFACSGGSFQSMKSRRPTSSGINVSGRKKMPPRALENVAGSKLTAVISPPRVSDQNPGPSAVLFQCTGHSERSRANSSCGGPSANRARSVRSTEERSPGPVGDDIGSSVVVGDVRPRCGQWDQCGAVRFAGLPPQVAQCAGRGVGAAHAVRAGAGRGGRRAEVHPRHAQPVGREGGARAEHQLADVLGAGHDVAADVVRVVGGHLLGRAHRLADDPLPEPGGEPLELGDDRLGGVPGVAVRDVRVRVDRVDIADRAARVSQILLADQDERPLRHPPRRGLPLVRHDLGEATGQVQCAGPARGGVGPRDTAPNREVDLEHRRAVPEPAQPLGHAAGQPVTQDLDDRARG